MQETNASNLRTEIENPMATAVRRGVRLSTPPTGQAVQSGAGQSFMSTPPGRTGELQGPGGESAEPFILDISSTDDPTQLML